MTLRIRSCRISISVFFLAALASLLLLDRSGMAPVGLACAVLHEAGHLAVMHALGCLPEKICFTLFGIDMVKPQKLNRSYRNEILISFAGPAANFTAAVFCYSFFRLRFPLFLCANLFLSIWSLLPIEPLDGGQILFYLLCQHWNIVQSQKIISVCSFVVLLPVAIAGFLVLLRSRGNFSLLFASCYLMALLLLRKDSLS